MESGAWKQALRDLGRERGESRGWGLSVHLHNQKALHAICSIYYLNLSQISFKHNILKNELLSTNVKSSAATSSLGLTRFFASHPQCIRCELPFINTCPGTVRYPSSVSCCCLSLNSSIAMQIKSSTTKKEGNFTLANGFQRSYEEKAMAPHSSTLAWKIPWTEEPDGLQSMGSR